MSANITIPADNAWHRIILPLSEFSETGSWDNNTWYNPAGEIEWSAIDQLEIATEQWNMGEYNLYFDNLLITREEETGTISNTRVSENDIIIKYSGESQSLNMINQSNQEIEFSLIDLMGRIYTVDHFGRSYTLSTEDLPQGLYL